MRILFASAELSPLIRTGGLGDAVAGLLGALARAGHEVSAALPRYRQLAGLGEPDRSGVWRLERDGVHLLLVDDPPAFDRPGVYGPEPGLAYEDSWFQWGRFAAAVADLADDFDVLHLHDAHVGATALLAPIPAVFTVHNPAHPVLGPLEQAAGLLGLGPDYIAPTAPLEWYGQANYLKAGLVGSSQATTVSPSFAAQLASSDSEESFGLGELIQSIRPPLVGILNGIDNQIWDPAADPLLAAPFSSKDPSGRAASRAALLERAGLEEGTIFGMVGRVSGQKGIPLLAEPIDALVDDGFRFVMVGDGDLNPMLDGWVERHPKAVAHFRFADDIARLVFGGADAYLMPSAFEPSGLGQLYAMRYGCPPVVRLTGGLADTVVDVDEHPTAGTGFGFREYLPSELAKTIRRAMRYRRELPDIWEAMQLRGMQTDWSWDRQALEYVKVYESVA